MASRFLALFACGLGLAVACGSDDEQQSVPDDAGGAPADAGAAPTSNAGSSATPGGSGGSGGSGAVSGGTGGSSTPLGGAGGEPVAPGGADSGGVPNEPTEPGISVCGAQKYQTGEGCGDCPALPTRNVPTTLSCQNLTRAFNDNDEYLELSFAQVPFHEPLGGTVVLEWKDFETGTPDGTAEVSWSYSPGEGQLLVALPFEARYADWWYFGTWTFADVCGFEFTAPNLTIDYNGEAYGCVAPT